jgi:hypothetical protein
MARPWLRVALTGVVAATVGIIVGFASSIAWSHVRDHLASISSFSRAETISRTPADGLAVVVEFVDASKTAAFEKAVFEAERHVRHLLARQQPTTPWFIYRSREHAHDGSVLYLLWFEQHGELESSALSNAGRLQTATPAHRCWPDHPSLTFVPVMSTTR